MLGDIIALIELILGRRQAVKETKRNLLENFIEPVFSSFKTVHENYLETFRSYRNEIQFSKQIDIHSLIKKIQEDSLFSQNLRSELITALSFPNEEVSSFVNSIGSYILYPGEALNISITPGANMPRISLIKALKQLADLTDKNINKTNLIDIIKRSLSPQNPNIIDLCTTPPKPPFYLVEQLMNYRGLEVLEQESFMFLPEAENSNLKQVNPELCNEIKRYLITRYIDFITQKIQENYDSVVRQYWKIKLELLGLDFAQNN